MTGSHLCRCEHPEAAHDAGDCWGTPDAHVNAPEMCHCPWFEPEPHPDYVAWLRDGADGIDQADTTITEETQ